MADWYYAKDGERLGPVSSSALRQLAQAGTLLPTDMVFKEGGSQWVLASTINNLFPAGGGAVATRPAAESSRSSRPAADEGSLSFGESGSSRNDDDGPSRRRSRSGGGGLGDLLKFRR